MKFLNQQLILATALFFSSEVLSQNVEINWLAGFADANARLMEVNEGDVLNFSWQGLHNVIVLTQEAFDACDLSAAENLGNVSPIQYTMTGETTYFACGIVGHCDAGQKLEARVLSDSGSDMQAEGAGSTIVDLAVGTADLSMLVELVTSAGLVETLSGEGPFTVFAPTNEAFAALPAEVLASVTGPENVEALVNVLTYHVVADAVILSSDLTEGAVVPAVNGGSLTVTSLTPPTINDSVVIQPDIMASNGVVHMIDAVLLPPPVEEAAPAAEAAAEEEAGSTIVELAVGTPDLSRLVELLTAAGLVETLSGDGPFTVFAPTNAAFDAVPAETMEALGADVNLLTSVLTYHVVPGMIMSTDLTEGAEVTAVNEGTLTVTSLSPPTINESEVVQADIMASNGVVHVIDAVLMPPAASDEPGMDMGDVTGNVADAAGVTGGSASSPAKVLSTGLFLATALAGIFV